ncbi:MAG: hypothetical protein K2I51_07285 [Muribaculaceae bacterium]|nr:hypothetical protein [Muribaculaceae bacterium]
MQSVSTYLLYAFEIGGLALNTAILYFILKFFIKICRQKDTNKIIAGLAGFALAILCLSGIMDGERSRASITEAVNFVLGLGITWTMAIIALLCLLMHTLFSLLHKKAPFD